MISIGVIASSGSVIWVAPNVTNTNINQTNSTTITYSIEVDNNTLPVTAYAIEVFEQNESGPDTSMGTRTTQSGTYSNLTTNVPYFMLVTATNAAGTGPQASSGVFYLT